MINLLPSEGKKKVIISYWMRVVSVYFMLVGIAFLVVGALLLPTYFYISFQTTALGGGEEAGGEGVLNFKELEAEIDLANDLSAVLTETPMYIDVSEVISEIQSFAGSKITIQTIAIEKDGQIVSSVVVTGRAADRASLVAFRDDAEANRLFTEINLPLSNLAEDQDIPFSLSLEPSEVLQTPL